MKDIISSLSTQPLDGLSMWFMAIFTVVFACGAIYGSGYMKHYSGRPVRNALHFEIEFTLILYQWKRNRS